MLGISRKYGTSRVNTQKSQTAIHIFRNADSMKVFIYKTMHDLYVQTRRKVL